MIDVAEMPRSLRGVLLGSIAIAFVYLLMHAREPLRFNVGDPWSDANVLTSINYVKSDGFLATSFTDVLDVGPLTKDSYRYIHYPPLPEIFYGAVGKYLGVSDIGTFRLFALAFSVLAMWLLFSYVRRLYSDRVALIATALFSTSLLWMMYADSIHQAPVMQCTGFLALWGVVRVIETRQRRHYAAMVLGAAACFFSSYDYYLFLPIAALVTIYLKAGNPFARGNRHILALCALGCVLGVVVKCLCVIGAVGWDAFVADLRLQFIERATSSLDRKFSSALPTIVRRITLVLTPFVWIPIVFHAVKALRAPNLTAAIKSTAAWMLVTALAFLSLFRQLAASQMLASQVLLPFYAIGSAVIADRLLDGSRLRRQLAVAWLVAAPLWSLYFMFTHPRSVLARSDVIWTNVYLAGHDHNDFVLSNMMSDGHIQAAFGRHSWPALDASDPSGAPREMMRIFNLSGVDYVHCIITTDAKSRFIDKALWPLAAPRSLWGVTGWPHVYRRKATSLITEYDGRVLSNLKAVHAKKVLELRNYAVYRVDRADVMPMLIEEVRTVRHIDFASVTAARYELFGWAGPRIIEGGKVVSAIWEMEVCPHERCKTKLTELGVRMPEVETRAMGQLMIRVDQVCDLALTFRFATPSHARLSTRGFTAGSMHGDTMTFTIPAQHLTTGVNIVELENMLPGTPAKPLYVSSLDLTQACPAPSATSR
jgi:hypothetical protein